MLADKWLSEAGIDAQAVSLKVLVPLLEYASLEDEADEADNPEDVEAMQRRWAALLANAAAGNEGAGVPPGFPRILSEIEAQDARLLEMIAADGPMSLGALFASSGIDMSDVAAVDRIQVRVDNLERLQLCTVYRPDPQLIEYAKSVEAVEQAESGFPFNAAPLSGMFKPRRHRPTISRTVGTTALGDAFIVACTAPTGAQGR